MRLHRAGFPLRIPSVKSVVRCCFLGVWCLGAWCLIATPCRAADAWRTFTDTSGRRMVAKILKVEAEQVILELKANGEHVTIAMDKLSASDAVFVLQHSGAEGTLPLTRPPFWPPTS